METYQIIKLGNGTELYVKPKELKDLNKILVKNGAKEYESQGETHLDKKQAQKSNLRFSTIAGLIEDIWGHTYVDPEERAATTLSDIFKEITGG